MRALATLAVGLERSLHDCLPAPSLSTRKRALCITSCLGGVNAPISGGGRRWAKTGDEGRRRGERRHHTAALDRDFQNAPSAMPRLRRKVRQSAHASSLVSVDAISIAGSTIAPAPISWELPRLRDRICLETRARRKCCSIVSQKRMSLRRFRNRILRARRPLPPVSRAPRKINSALIFDVFTSPTE